MLYIMYFICILHVYEIQLKMKVAKINVYKFTYTILKVANDSFKLKQ